jgi:uroporphyrinogen-III synthase
MSKSTSFLSGRRIVITRASDQNSALRERLEQLGATVLELPLIKVTMDVDKQTLADCMLELGGYDWVIFTSANGVRGFFEIFFKLFEDIRSLGLLRIACVGETTAKAVQALHLKVECMPKKATSESLAEELIATGSLDSARVLMVTGNLNREVIEKKLEEARAIVDRLPVYKTEQNDISALPVTADFKAAGADAILFGSSSAVDSYAAQSDALRLNSRVSQPLLGSIGPQTSESLRKAGLPVDFEAATPGFDDLIAALRKALPKA